MSSSSANAWLRSASLALVVAMIFAAVWKIFHDEDVALHGKVASLEAAIADAGAHDEETCKRCSTIAEERGRVEGYERAQADQEDIRKEIADRRKQTEAMAKPRCNPMLPPYEPCCGEDAQAGGITEDAFPTPEEFKERHNGMGRLLTLSCARTAAQRPEQGAPWVCARTEAKCVASKQRAGACVTCYVHLASGAASHEDFVWTGHAIDEVDGPWTVDGKKGVFP